MRSDARLAIVSAVTSLVIAAACARAIPGPEITSVSPSANKADVTRSITISGNHFFRRIVPDAGNPSDSTRGDLRAELAGAAGVVPLLVTTNVTLTQIVALVPSNSAPGNYDVIVHADGGDARLSLGYSILGPPVALFVSSAVEAAPGTENLVTIDVVARDAGDNLSTFNAPVNFTVQFVGTAAFAIPSPSFFTVAAGSTGTSFTIHDPRVESFAVVVLDSTGASTLTGSGHATFIPGPAAVGRVTNTTEIGTTNAASAFFRIEDVDGNLEVVHPTYGAAFGMTGGSCPAALVTPASASMTNGVAVLTLSLNCGPGASVETVTVSPIAGLVTTDGVATFN